MGPEVITAVKYIAAFIATFIMHYFLSDNRIVWKSFLFSTAIMLIIAAITAIQRKRAHGK